MKPKTILKTKRLILREFDLEDAPFILELVNTPNWLAFIGDRGVRNIKDAENYLINGPIKSYQENGFGLWLVSLEDSLVPIGMCGLVNRETLDDIDIGFAMLPNYAGKGFGYEIASATMDYAKIELKIERVIAITDPNNIASINLLKKIGLTLEKTEVLSSNDSVLVFTPKKNDAISQ